MASNRPARAAGLPLLAAAMLLAAGVSAALAACMLLAYADPDRIAQTRQDVFWTVFWTGLSDGIALSAGFVAYRRLQAKIRRLQEEIRDLAGAVLHDLKTHVTHIHNHAAAAAEGEADPEEAIPDILESCERISDVINANAEISRMLSGRLSAPDTPLDAAALARRSAGFFGDMASYKGISFGADIPRSEILLRMHKAHFQHIVHNLLDNAIKFTPRGGRVAITLSRSGRNASIRVEDSGCGIPPDKIPRIFERFYRADPSRDAPGHGLGLAMVDAVVTSYGGKVSVRSSPDCGSTFAITLPAVPFRHRSGEPAGNRPSESVT